MSSTRAVAVLFAVALVSCGSLASAALIPWVANTITWNISFSGLTGAATSMHFHGPAGPGQGASPRVNIGATTNINSPSNAVTPVSVSGQFVNEVKSGLWYINIHTAGHGSSEIRGQVIAIPEPPGFILSGMATMAPMSIRWGRKRC